MRRGDWARGRVLLVSCILLASGAACAGGGGDGAGDPAAAVVSYLQAKVASNQAELARLLCASQEGTLEREVNSFENIEARLEDVTCQAEGEVSDPTATVACTGAIVAVYNGEDTVFPLTRYQVVQEGGEWRWCGEAP
jgi:hypothetical protein